jgi:hypothetical protein
MKSPKGYLQLKKRNLVVRSVVTMTELIFARVVDQVLNGKNMRGLRNE